MRFKSNRVRFGRCLLGAFYIMVLPIMVLPFAVRAAGYPGVPATIGPPEWIAEDGSNRTDTGETKEGLYCKVHFTTPLKLSALKPGDTVEGVLSNGVYSADREVFPAGSRVRLTVDRLERARKAPNDHWPWVIKAFAPRHQNRPVFSAASVILSNGREIPLKVSLISISDKRDVRVQWRKEKAAVSSSGKTRATTDAASSPQAPQASPSTNATDPREPHRSGLTAAFEAFEVTSGELGHAALGDADSGPSPLPATIEAGTQARVILLGAISASKSHPGDVIAARLVEPVRKGSKVLLPEGSVFEGKVVKVSRPKWLSRSGSLLLTFDRLILPGGTGAPVSASIIGAELDASSRTKIDPEGNMSGDRPGKAWMLINLGTSLGLAKVADDGTQLVIQLIVSTATDASTAGVARIVAACISGVFMVTRHGRDVVLPKYTEMQIALDGPVSLTPVAGTPPLR